MQSIEEKNKDLLVKRERYMMERSKKRRDKKASI